MVEVKVDPQADARSGNGVPPKRSRTPALRQTLIVPIVHDALREVRSDGERYGSLELVKNISLDRLRKLVDLGILDCEPL